LTEKDYESQPKLQALGVLDGLVAELEKRTPEVDVRTAIEEGNPAKVLIERSKGADLMVVGSRGHGGFAGMLLGSVSQHLVAHAECPVVVVR
jgi:nucleotide-binding universal stress UspA family protein